MNGSTPIPVSRDDILMNDINVRNEFLSQIEKLYILSKDNVYEYPKLFIYSLYLLGENRYIDYYINKYISEGYYVVPFKYMNSYKLIIKDNKLCPLFIDTLPYEINNKLMNLGNQNFYIYKSVFFIDGDILSDEGSSNLLFIGNDLIKDKDENQWLINILTAGEQFGLSLMNTLVFNDNSDLIFNTFLQHFEASKIKYNYVDKNDERFINFFNLMIDIDSEHANVYLKEYITLLATKLKVSYSDNRRTLQCNQLFKIRMYYPGDNETSDFYPSAGEYGGTIKTSQKQLNRYFAIFRMVLKDLKIFALKNDYIIIILFPPNVEKYRLCISLKELWFLDLIKNTDEYVYMCSIISRIKSERDCHILLDLWRYKLKNPNNINIIHNYIISKSKLNSNNLKIYILNIVDIHLNIYQNNLLLIDNNLSIPDIINYNYSYTLKNLLNMIFTTDIINDGESFIYNTDKISSYTNDIKLQILDIAINEGTTKNPILSSITETFQNSLDIHRLKNIHKNIEINIYKSVDLLYYSIKDYGGISPNGLLSLSIPFLSSKDYTVNNITGEIGSGFFNVYRQSYLVKIETVYNNIKYIFYDTPIISDNKIIDINRKTQFYKIQSSDNYTIIEIYFKISNDNDPIISEVINYIYNILPISSDITVNHEILSINKKLLVKGEGYELYNTYKIGNKYKTYSYLLTKGIPFQPLVDYLINTINLESYIIEQLSINFICNLHGNVYSPTQSRTKLQISNIDIFRKTFIKYAYISSLENQLDDPSHNYIDNYNISNNILQVLPYENVTKYYNLNTFILYYKLDDDEYLALLLVKLYKLITTGSVYIYDKNIKLSIKNLEIVNEYLNLINNQSLRKIVVNWFLNKKTIHSVYIIKPEYIKQNLITSSVDKNSLERIKYCENFCQSYVDIYWQLLNSLDIPEIYNNIIERTPFLEIKNIDSLGYYNNLSHTIVLNISIVNYVPIKSINSVIDLITLFKSDARDIFGKSYPASLLVHELSHAFNKNEHSTGIHGDIILTIDNKENTYSFDDAANIVFDKICLLGFYQKLFNSLILINFISKS